MLTRWFGVILGLWSIDCMPDRLDVDDALLSAADTARAAGPLAGPA